MMRDRYSFIDKTKWVVFCPGPLTASGHHEIVASFATRREAEAWIKEDDMWDRLQVARRWVEG